MMRLLLLLIAVLMLGQDVHALRFIPFYEFNLDLPPSERWPGAVDLILSRHSWNESFGALFDAYETPFKTLPQPATSNLIIKVMQERFPENFQEAQGMLKAFAKHGHGEWTMLKFAPWFWFYEFFHMAPLPTPPPKTDDGFEKGKKTLQQEENDQYKNRKEASSSTQPSFGDQRHGLERACTGILALPSDLSQPILHGRNLDEQPHQVKNLTLQFNITRKGKVLYQAVTGFWILTGFPTTQRHHGVTIEINWRSKKTEISYQELMQKIDNNISRPVEWVQRYIQEDKQMNFEETVSFFATPSKHLFAAPFYMIISGTQRRGAVVTVGWDEHRHLAHLNDTSAEWFMVQTNYDRWKPDPSWDPRRTVAEDTLYGLGRQKGATPLGVWMVLSTYPVQNENTLFTAMLSVEEEMQAYVRRAMVPLRGYLPNVHNDEL